MLQGRKEDGRPFRNISKMEASVDLDRDHLSKLVLELESDKAWPSSTGRKTSGRWRQRISNIALRNVIMGLNDDRLYRRDLPISMGGYPVGMSPYTVLVKSLNMGMKQRRSPAPAIGTDGWGFSKEGTGSGYFQWGRGMHRPDYHTLLTLPV